MSASTGAGSILAPTPAVLPAPAPRAPPPFATQQQEDASNGRAPRPNFQFDLRDIDKSSSASRVFKLQSVQFHPRDPLDPVYRLARVQERPITPPRFIRDQMAVDDIGGTRPRAVYSRAEAREVKSLFVDDLGPSARPLARYVAPPRPLVSLESRDITSTHFVSQRHTSPLDPEYNFGRTSSLDVSSLIGGLQRQAKGTEEEKQQSEESLMRFGPIPGSKVRRSPSGRQEHTADLSLRTHDISSPEAASWSWTKPARTLFRSTTNTLDIPGAQTGADRSLMHKTKRQTNPNARDYSDNGLGGARVSDQDGMVHVHRHVLDGSPYGGSWKLAQGEPASDAAGVSVFRTGNLTAGSQPPRATTAVPSRARPAFGAPAEDTFASQGERERAPATSFERAATPSLSASPASSASFSPSPSPIAAESSPDSSVVFSDIAPTASSAVAASSPSSDSAARLVSSYYLSKPIDTRKGTPSQKRHHAREGYHPTSGLLYSPPSDGKECVPAPKQAAHVPLMTFGVRGPFSVASVKASIQESQGAATVSATSAAAVARALSRPNSSLALVPGGGGFPRPASATEARLFAQRSATPVALSGKQQFLSSLSPNATTISNAFSLSYVPGAATLPRSVPYSSPLSRPGISTVERLERGSTGTRGMDILARTQERKMATLRAAEIQQVRALG